MDNFLEEVATKRNRGAETVMYVLANIMMVVFGLWAFLMLQGIMMLINAGEGAGPIIYYVVMTLLTGGIAVLLFLRRDRIRTEYEYTFTNLQPGEHEVGITVYGNRVNGFGCVHNCDDSTSWFGPDCWRSEGVRWCYEYRLRKSGLLVSPQIEK